MLTDKVIMMPIQLMVVYGNRKGTFTLTFHKLLQRLYTASYVAVSGNKNFFISLRSRIKIQT